MDNIKEMIGQRILESRKAKGLTRKALAELTDDLKQSRINNWERGIRTPGSEEIKQLAKALEVSPAYLMCLSDVNHNINDYRLIPLLDHRQACNSNLYSNNLHEQNNLTLISVSTILQPNLSSNAFALKMQDDSMTPEFRINDVLVIDPLLSPKPSDFVVVKITGNDEAIVCQYKKLSYTAPEFELLTLNDNWPNIKISNEIEVVIVGTVVQSVRVYR